MEVKTLRKDQAGLGMKRLTLCQANMTREGMTTVRRNPVGPSIKLLTS